MHLLRLMNLLSNEIEEVENDFLLSRSQRERLFKIFRDWAKGRFDFDKAERLCQEVLTEGQHVHPKDIYLWVSDIEDVIEGHYQSVAKVWPNQESY